MKWLLSLVLVLLAVGTLRVVGCNWDILENPCAGVDCGDGNPCTQDYCTHFFSSPSCHNEPLRDGAPCGDSKVCVDGDCREDLCAECEDDANNCTVDCDYNTGVCGYTKLPDGSECKGERHRGECWSGVCVVCQELDCNDGDICTNDDCITQEGGCIHWPVSCRDGDACTADMCDPGNGECVHVPTDGNWCEFEPGLIGSCESGRCTGLPCDVSSEERYACPVRGGEGVWECCPGESEYVPRGYCITDGVCDDVIGGTAGAGGDIGAFEVQP